MVMFHFNGATCEEPESCPVGLHYYFDYAAETEFSFDTLDDLLDTATSCQIKRGGSGEYRAFFGVNNFLRIPSQTLAATTNSVDFVRPRVEACINANEGNDVSFLYVDYWSIGDVLGYVITHNRNLLPELNTTALNQASNAPLQR